MTATVLAPVQLTGTTALTSIGGAVPAGKKRRYDLRACNVSGTSADGYADVRVVDNENGGNTGYRCRNFHIPYGQTSSAPDLEYGLVLTEGMELQVRASADNTIAFSLTGVEDDA